jgi:type II secretory ATPase GspE/PulE/Tfp pilus assembly ATPase PilB-like protein
MTAPLPIDVATALRKLDAASPLYATQFVEFVLASARDAGASDVHIHPVPSGLEVRWRVDGVLQCLGQFPRGRLRTWFLA